MRLLVSLLLLPSLVESFIPQHRAIGPSTSSRWSTSADTAPEDEQALLWNLFLKHHARGSWKGIWTTYDSMGDVQDETVASVDLLATTDDTVQHAHTIVVGAKRSDCATCFDSMETKTFPVASYAPQDMKQSRIAGCSLVNGPRILRSGAVATELVLSHGDGRVRVVFQHAPVWASDEQLGPPDGLKLFRVTVSREALRDTAPTRETEEAHPPAAGNPTFYRPVPPFDWHKHWSGSSWTWGAQSGNQGWFLEELEETDAWHGANPPEFWNLRLPGGIFLQTDRIISELGVGLVRLAWMPDTETLLRVEGGMLALQPMAIEDDEVEVLAPPSLVSLRCDMLQKVGDLEGQPMFAKEEPSVADAPTSSPELGTASSEASSKSSAGSVRSEISSSDDEPPSGLKAIRDSIKL